MQNLLSIMIYLPACAAFILAMFLRGNDREAQLNAKMVALVASCATLLCTVFVLDGFDSDFAGGQMIEERDWVWGFRYRFGVDGISLPFVLLITGVMPMVVLAVWDVTERVKVQMIAVLLAESMLLGAAMAQDIFLFYGFFDGLGLAIFLLIGIGPGKMRMGAALKFIMFYMASSLAVLFVIVALQNLYASGDFAVMQAALPRRPTVDIFGLNISQTVIVAIACFGLMVRMGLWPVAAWLSSSHKEGTIAGGIIMSSLLVPLAGYGLIRLAVSALPAGWVAWGPVAVWIGCVSLALGTLWAVLQRDLRVMVSLLVSAQMGAVLVGLGSASRAGLDGAMLFMVTLGLSAAALLIAVHFLTRRISHCQLDAFGGLLVQNKRFAMLLLLLVLVLSGAPGGGIFAAHLVTVFGAYTSYPLAAIALCLGWVAVAGVLLYVFNQIMGGELVKARLKDFADLTGKELMIVFPLMLMIFLLGFMPMLLLDLSSVSFELLAQRLAGFVVGGTR